MYTNIYDVIRDISLYGIAKQGGEETLDLFPQIAKSRWMWIIENWVSLKQRMLDYASGDVAILNLIFDFEKEIATTKAGGKINPMDTSQKFNKFKPLLEQISLNELKLTDPEISIRDDSVFKAGEFLEEDFRSMLSFLKSEKNKKEQEIGLGDPTINKIYNEANKRKQRNPSIKDMEMIGGIIELYQLVEGLIFNAQKTAKRPPNLLRINNQNIEEDSDVRVVDTYQTFVPVPFEFDLQHMARKYLGNVDRWYEIVTVNNLQSPYVDNSGTKIFLTAPASSNTVTVPNNLRNSVAPGVKINIGSQKYPEETRTIERVTFSGNSMTLVLGGKNDLVKMLPKHKSFIRIFKPSTVRNNSFIMIPSNNTAEYISKKTPNSDKIGSIDRAFIQFGIDIKRDEKSGDFIIGPNGNFSLAYGFPAVRQAVLNALKTKVGELPFHPRYGVNHDVGYRFFGTVDEAVIFADAITDALLSDDRLDDIKIADVQALDTGISLKLLVKIKGFDQFIPLSFVS